MVAVTDIFFIPTKKFIFVHPFPYTILSAVQGNNYVDVNQVIDVHVPQSATLVLAKSCATAQGAEDVSGGYDWSSDPQDFKIIAGSCHGQVGFDNLITITLDANCPTINAIVAHINAKFSAAGFGYINEAYITESGCCVGIRNKTAFCGETGAFYLENDGSECALTTLGIIGGTYQGESDVYEYVSWSGSRFNLTTTLTRNYSQNEPALARRLTYTCQEIYNLTMDWIDSQSNMPHDVPMMAVGYASLGGGSYTDKIFILINGWKIRPTEGDYIITFIGTLITDDNSERVSRPKAGAIQSVFQVSSQGISSVTGSGVTSQDKIDIANLVEAQTGSPIKTKLNDNLDIPVSTIADLVWIHTVGSTLADRVNLIRKIEEGRWKIMNNQLIIYDEDGIIPLKIFNLKNKLGQPAEKDVFERVPL